jgi:alcohol dehydrogenase class IV
MKNLLTIVVFALVMIFSVQSTNAQGLKQNEQKAEVVAKTQVAELSAELGLSGDQQRTLFRAFVQKEVNYRKQVNGKSTTDATVVSNKKNIDATFKATVKKYLTDEQYKKWLSKL